MLKQKRGLIIKEVKAKADFLGHNEKVLNIYEGELKPFIYKAMKDSLSEHYFNSIKDRILPVNILQRYADKVSTTYSKPPKRESGSEIGAKILDFYKDKFDINASGMMADVYSHLHKGFAWEPYINQKGQPSLREIPFDRFMVISTSDSNPEEETIFVKIMGRDDNNPDRVLLFAYSDNEFDAFWTDESDAPEYMSEDGTNPIRVIPFVYGKRQRNRLVPVPDTDLLAMTIAIPMMLSDTAGAQMFQAFSVMYGIDVNAENMVMTPNAWWSLKSDKQSDKTPSVGTIKPTADTDKAMNFIIQVFVLWLETKGIRVGSVGTFDAASVASGISKIIDEMDTWEIKKKSQKWFKVDEEELWNEKLPKIHNYWIKTGQLKTNEIGLIPDNSEIGINVDFDEPKPMTNRTSEIAEVKSELEIKTMTMQDAIKKLHPDWDENKVQEVMDFWSAINGQLLSEDTATEENDQGRQGQSGSSGN